MKKIHPLKTTRNLIVTYTIIFVILIVGVYALLWIQGRTLVNHADAYDQGYFWTVEMKRNLASLFGGDGYPLWTWYKGTGFDTKLPVDPFMIIASLFPIGYIELGYTIAIILRMYCAGLAFIALGNNVSFDNFQCLLGAISYVFSSWVLNLALVQGTFMNFVIVFPLLVLSVNKIYEGKSPWLFIASVAWAAGSNYYLAYMAAIGIILYLLLRYFHYYEKFNLKQYATYFGRFIIYGISGIMIAAVFMLLNIQLVSSASTGSGNLSIDVFFSLKEYLKVFKTILSSGYAFSYQNIGIPIFALLVWITSFRKISIKDTPQIMFMLLFMMFLIPFFGYLFNGFGYLTKRWYFLFVFFAVWNAAECMDFEKLKEKKNVLLMSIWLLILAIGSLGFAFFDLTGDYSLGGACFVGGNLVVGFVIILLISLGERFSISVQAKQAIVTCLTVVTLVICWNCSLYGHENHFFRNGGINNQLTNSTQRAGNQINDHDFYRIDQVDWINFQKKADQPVNENLWWETNTLYFYDSKLPEKLSEFNRLLGNNYGYSKRVYVQSNGNRMGLDFLYGVKYFLGNDTRDGETGSDEYADYGFSYFDNIDGVNVYKNKYSSGLGFEYDSCISESEFLKLSRLEREQSLLQAIVIPDDEIDNLQELTKLSASDIEIDIDDIPYSVTETTGLTIDGNTITVDKAGATATIRVSPVYHSQLVVSFDNLQRVNDSGKNVGDFYLSCSSSKLTAAANNTYNSQTIGGIVDYDLNMGYYDSYDGLFTIKFSRAGTYTYDNLYVSAMSTDNYDKYAGERSSCTFSHVKQTWSSVRGKVSAGSDGLMFFSMPVNENWDVYIDGKKAEKISNANIAFFAVKISEGAHVITLKYNQHNRYIALAITLAGLALAVTVCLLQRRRSHHEKAVC